jgi:putative redox protein
MKAPSEVVVRGAATGFKQTIEAGGVHLVADEPTELGGTNDGPTPYDYLLTALGSCTSMTVGLYARKHGWPLTDVTVRLKHERIHETDCEECAEHPRRIERITLTLELAGALSDEQRARLREVAGRCPVHQTLTSKLDIRIQ